MSPSVVSGAHENDSPLLRSSAAAAAAAAGVAERREEAADFLGDLDLDFLGDAPNPGGGGVPW